MTDHPKPTYLSSHPKTPCRGYRLTVRGCLGFETLLWLGYDARTDTEQDLTAIHLPTCDQAALYGAILKLRDLGLTLLAVNLVGDEPPLVTTSSLPGDPHGNL